MLGLLDERHDAVGRVDVHDAETRRFGRGHLEAGDGDIRARVDVLHEHALVVHLVDVVAGENDDVLGRVVVDDVDVLEHGIGGAGVPLVLGHALAGGQDVEALVAHRLQEVPAALQVADQAVRLVLGGHRDAPDAGIERVGEREVDDARLAAEVDGRLRAPLGELHEARAAATGQHVRHRGPGEGGGVRNLVHGPTLGSALGVDIDRRSHAPLSCTSQTAPSGGTTRLARWAKPWLDPGSATTTPALPQSVPPYTAASVLRISRQRPGSGRPMR